MAILNILHDGAEVVVMNNKLMMNFVQKKNHLKNNRTNVLFENLYN